MKIKINSKRQLYSLLLILSYFVETCCFRLLPIPQSMQKIWGPDRHFFLLLIGIIFCGFFYTRNTRIFKECSFTTRYITGLIVCLMLLNIYSVARYSNQNMSTILINEVDYLLVIFSYQFYYFMKKYGVDSFFKILNIPVVIYALLTFAQQMIYKFYGIVFLQDINLMVVRNDALRLSVGSLCAFWSLYNFYRIVNRNKNKFFYHLLSFLIESAALIFVNATRALIFAYAVCLLLALLLNGDSTKHSIRLFLLFITIGVLAVSSGFLDYFITSFSIESFSDNEARLGAFIYYWNEFLRSPIFGDGFIVNSSYYTIKYGPLLNFYYVDVGIIGALGEIGIFSLFIVIYPLVHWIRVYKHAMNNGNRSQYGLFLVAICYVIFTLPTLLITNNGRSFLFPVFFAMFEVLSKDGKLGNTITLST